MKGLFLVVGLLLAGMPAWAGPITLLGVGGSGVPALVEPCDIIASGGQTCVAAYSVTRRMFAAYSGNLFQLQRLSDNTTLNVGSNAITGLVDTSAIAAFCAATTCNYRTPYDQTGNNNSMPQATASLQTFYAVDALDNLPVIQTIIGTVGTGTLYYLRTGTTNIPTGAAPITVYYVRTNESSSYCCGDFGDTESTIADTGTGHIFGLGYSGEGGLGITGGNLGPSLELENGGVVGAPVTNPSVFTVLGKWDGTTNVTLKSGDAFSAALSTLYTGAPPATPVMEGGVALGSIGDGSPGYSAFHEGAIVAGTSSTATDNALQANVVATYGPKKVVYTCGSAYCGPGDIATTWNMWGGLRAFSAATRGQNAAHVCLQSNTALCADFATDATTGALVPVTISGSSCASVTCVVETLYDRSSNGIDFTVPFNVPPILVLNDTPGGRACMRFSGSNTGLYNLTAVPTLTQPFAIEAVYKKTLGAGFFPTIAEVGAFAGPNDILMFTGNNPNSSGIGHAGSGSDFIPYNSADGFWNTVTVIANSNSSLAGVNGGYIPMTAGMSGTNPDQTFIGIGQNSAGMSNFVGDICEIGFRNGSMTPTQISTLGFNGEAYYGY